MRYQVSQPFKIIGKIAVFFALIFCFLSTVGSGTILFAVYFTALSVTKIT
jgi:hypothetical protein